MSDTMTMREQLLEQEPIPEAHREAYEAALRSLFERRLGGWERARYVLPATGGLIVAVGLFTLALTEPATTPPTTRGLLFVMAAMGAGWFGIGLRVLRRGSVHLVRDRRLVVRAALVCTALQTAFFAWRSAKEAAALPGLVVASTLLLFAVGCWILQSLEESRLAAREERLRARVVALRGSRDA